MPMPRKTKKRPKTFGYKIVEKALRDTEGKKRTTPITKRRKKKKKRKTLLITTETKSPGTINGEKEEERNDQGKTDPGSRERQGGVWGPLDQGLTTNTQKV